MTGSRTRSIAAVLLRTAGASALLVACTALLLAVVWWQRAAILPGLANLWLGPELRIVRMEQLQLQRDAVHLQQLDLQLADGSVLQIRDLSVAGTLPQLLRAEPGPIHAGAVQVTRAERNGQPPAAGNGSPEPPVEGGLAPGLLLESLRQILASRTLPALTISQLRLATWPHALQLTLTPQRNTLQLLLAEVAAPDALQLSLQLKWPEQDNWPVQGTLALDPPSQHWGFDFHLDRSADQLQAAVNLQLDGQQLAPLQLALAQRLPAMQQVPDDLPADGLIYLQLRGSLTDQWPVTGTLPLRVVIGAGSELRLPPQTLKRMLPDLDTNQPLHINWPGVAEIDLQVSVDGGLQALSIAGTALRIVAAGNLQLPALQIHDSQLQATRHVLNCPTMDNCYFALLGDFSAEQVDWLELSLQRPATDALRLQGHLHQQQVNITLDRDLQISLPQMEGLGYLALNTSLKLEAPLQAMLPLQQLDALQVHTAALAVELPLIRAGDMMTGLRLRLESLQMRPLPPLRLQADLALRNVYTNLMPLNLWDARFDGNIDWDNDDLHLTTRVTLGDERWLEARTHYDLSQQRAVVDWQIPALNFDPLVQPLSSMIDPVPINMDLLAGTLSGQGQLHWQQQDNGADWHTSLVLAAEDLGGFYEDIGFVNLRTVLRAEIRDNRLSSVERGSLALARVDAGIALEDISLDYRLQQLPLTQEDFNSPWQLQLENFRLSLFGGQVTATHIDYRHLLEDNTALLELRGIDLRQVLALSPYEGVSASGLLDGTLPITLAAGGLTIAGGQLRARPPGGDIRYRDGPGSTGNPGLDLMYQALENYNYHSMEADVDYHDDGVLLLSVRMQGISTEVNRGQRINLNVNVSDNVPALIESLQASQNIADAVRLRLLQRNR